MLGRWLFNTASSPEFWKSLTGFAMSAGVALDPDQINAIISIGLAFMGAINAFKHVTRDKPQP